MASAGAKIYQLKVSLDHVAPPVWRRLLVPADVTLPNLHRILQIAMGWYDCHLHAFRTGEAAYLEPDPDAGMPLEGERDERRVRLGALLKRPRQSLKYEYDFGDGWEHTILLEKILEPEPGAAYPVCTAAKRACPPEDCGGPYGYMDLLEILADRKHPRHKELRDWTGGDFDAEAVYIADINTLLAPKPARRRRPTAGTGES